MYGKIFDSMYDGTISANWQGLVTFQQLIVLCDADGVIDMTPPALSRRTGIPLEIIEKGIEYLEAPDPYSRTQGHDGARIVRLDEHRPWGWFIVNHSKYKSLQDKDHIRAENRKRKQKQRAREAQNVTNGHVRSRHTDTNTNKEKDIYAQTPGFCAWWEVYPRKKDKFKAHEIWQRKNLESRSDELIVKLKEQMNDCESFNRDMTKIAYGKTYLYNNRFDDPIEMIEQTSNQNKSQIKNEIMHRLKQSPHDDYTWKQPEAQQAWQQIMKTCNLWQANEFQINKAISEAI